MNLSEQKFIKKYFEDTQNMNGMCYVSGFSRDFFLEYFSLKDLLDFSLKYDYYWYNYFFETEFMHNEIKYDILMYSHHIFKNIYVADNKQFVSKNKLVHLNQVFRVHGIELGNILSTASWLGQHYWFVLTQNYKSFTFNEVDRRCVDFLTMFNKKHNINSPIIYESMMYIDYSKYNTVINTSCEHINFREWLKLIPKGTLLFLQTTNYEHKEHINTHESLEEFVKQANLDEIFYTHRGEAVHNSNRFTLIGLK